MYICMYTAKKTKGTKAKKNSYQIIYKAFILAAGFESDCRTIATLKLEIWHKKRPLIIEV
jgi:hypothetical protein